MLSGLITAVLQLLAAKFLSPFVLQAAEKGGAMVKIKDYALAEPFFYAGALGLMIFLIGLVVSIVMGARLPLIGAFLLAIVFALAPAALEKFMPGLHAQVMGYVGQLATHVKTPLDKNVLVALAAFLGYWVSVALRSPSR